VYFLFDIRVFPLFIDPFVFQTSRACDIFLYENSQTDRTSSKRIATNQFQERQVSPKRGHAHDK